MRKNGIKSKRGEELQCNKEGREANAVVCDWHRSGCLQPAAEACKKGTLKVDLQALTVGVAVVSMGAWLLHARTALLHDAAAPLDASRKLAIVNGLGEHSRAQVCYASLSVFWALQTLTHLLLRLLHRPLNL